MFVSLLTAVSNFSFPQVLELLPEDLVAFCTGAGGGQDGSELLDPLQLCAQGGNCTHKKKQFCLNPVPFKEPRKQLQEGSRSRVLEDLSPTPGPPREETSQGAGAEPRGAKHKEQRGCISSWEHPRFGYSAFMGS